MRHCTTIPDSRAGYSLGLVLFSRWRRLDHYQVEPDGTWTEYIIERRNVHELPQPENHSGLMNSRRDRMRGTGQLESLA